RGEIESGGELLARLLLIPPPALVVVQDQVPIFRGQTVRTTADALHGVVRSERSVVVVPADRGARRGEVGQQAQSPARRLGDLADDEACHAIREAGDISD